MFVSGVQGEAEDASAEAEDAATGPEEQFQGGVAKEALGGARGLEAVVDGGQEGVAIQGFQVDALGDAHPQGDVLLHAQGALQGGETDEPEREQVAAVEGEVEEAAEIGEEAVGEVLGLINDEDDGGAALIGQVAQGLFDVIPELGATMRRADAQFDSEGAIQVQGRDLGVAQVQDLIVRARETVALTGTSARRGEEDQIIRTSRSVGGARRRREVGDRRAEACEG